MKQATELIICLTPDNCLDPEFASEGEAYQKHDDIVNALAEADKERKEIEDNLPF